MWPRLQYLQEVLNETTSGMLLCDYAQGDDSVERR